MEKFFEATEGLDLGLRSFSGGRGAHASRNSMCGEKKCGFERDLSLVDFYICVEGSPLGFKGHLSLDIRIVVFKGLKQVEEVLPWPHQP